MYLCLLPRIHAARLGLLSLWWKTRRMVSQMVEWKCGCVPIWEHISSTNRKMRVTIINNQTATRNMRSALTKAMIKNHYIIFASLDRAKRLPDCFFRIDERTEAFELFILWLLCYEPLFSRDRLICRFYPLKAIPWNNLLYCSTLSAMLYMGKLIFLSWLIESRFSVASLTSCSWLVSS